MQQIQIFSPSAFLSHRVLCAESFQYRKFQKMSCVPKFAFEVLGHFKLTIYFSLESVIVRDPGLPHRKFKKKFSI